MRMLSSVPGADRPGDAGPYQVLNSITHTINLSVKSISLSSGNFRIIDDLAITLVVLRRCTWYRIGACHDWLPDTPPR